MTICSASQGLGKQILAAFTLSGAHGAVVDLKQDSADQACRKLIKDAKNAGLPEPQVHGYECDTSSEDGVKNTWEKIVKEFGKVDILGTFSSRTSCDNISYPRPMCNARLFTDCMPSHQRGHHWRRARRRVPIQ